MQDYGIGLSNNVHVYVHLCNKRLCVSNNDGDQRYVLSLIIHELIGVCKALSLLE